jgi:predicted metal-dependent phosphoesterase TrpH
MDHNDIRGALDAVRCCEYLKSSGSIPREFLVVPGVEVNSTVGHIGALFVERDLPIALEPAEMVKAIHEAGGLAVAVHPYHSTGIGDAIFEAPGDAIFEAPFDAVEIECGSVFGRRLVKRNRELSVDARLSGVARLGSSDAHYIHAMASCYTVVKLHGPPTLDALRRAIAAGDCEPRTSKPYERLAGLLGSIRKLR